MTPEEEERLRISKEVHARQKARNIVLGLILAGLGVLFFALTVVRFPNPGA